MSHSTGRTVLASAVLSLVVSPLTAVWAALAGSCLLVAGAATRTLRPGGFATTLTSIGVGAVLGVLPYFVLAALQTARD